MLSVRLHLSVLKEIRNCMTALGVLWFPAGLFPFWISDHGYKNKDLL